MLHAGHPVENADGLTHGRGGRISISVSISKKLNPMAQILLHLPEDLARRFRSAVPARQRSSFVQKLLEEALPQESEDPLYLAALAVEEDASLNAEMAEWEEATVGDGLGPDR